MARRRALLTDRERELIADEDAGNQRYVAISRVRTKIEDELTEDLHILADKHPDLLTELREVVCEGVDEEDIAAHGSSEREKSPARDPHRGIESDNSNPGEMTRETGKDSGVRERVSEVDFPSSRDRTECVEAVQAAYQYLQREGAASMREFVQEVMPEHPVGYDVPDLQPGDRYRGAWWRKVVKPGLSALSDVKAPTGGASEWKHADPPR